MCLAQICIYCFLGELNSADVGKTGNVSQKKSRPRVNAARRIDAEDIYCAGGLLVTAVALLVAIAPEGALVFSLDWLHPAKISAPIVAINGINFFIIIDLV
jgi:hypothetical protein